MSTDDHGNNLCPTCGWPLGTRGWCPFCPPSDEELRRALGGELSPRELRIAQEAIRWVLSEKPCPRCQKLEDLLDDLFVRIGEALEDDLKDDG